ncbi:hypothetical protein HY449_00895 [Candidatus Pacearchaeota archaeon]|nr:hypothetical protein [Candidatus Pacearchaeota archaeon]
MGKILEPFKGIVAPRTGIFDGYVNGRQIYRFDKSTRILELSISPEEIENFLVDYIMPMNVLTLPPPVRRTFERVKKVDNLPPGKSGKYYFGYGDYGFYIVQD